MHMYDFRFWELPNLMCPCKWKEGRKDRDEEEVKEERKEKEGE